MHRRRIAVAMASVLTLSLVGITHAAPLAPADHVSTPATKAKMVSFTVRNGSTVPLVLHAGDQQITIAPGKSVAIKLAEGAQILTVNATSQQAAGSVLTVVSKQLQGNTLVVS